MGSHRALSVRTCRARSGIQELRTCSYRPFLNSSENYLLSILWPVCILVSR